MSEVSSVFFDASVNEIEGCTAMLLPLPQPAGQLLDLFY
jgi:hypothetical protein